MASELTTRSLYAGAITVVHNPNARGSQPRYIINETKKPKGVTTILGQTLNKDLMQWAVDCMKDSLMAKLPTVSQEDLEDSALEYTRRRDFGAATGTEAHALVERFLKGETVNTEASSIEAKNAAGAFMDWFEITKPEVLGVEELVYSMTYEYAGTFDALLKIDGRVYLCDLKTTNASRKAPNGIYAENFLQLGAYAGAYEENRVHELENGNSSIPKIDGLMVISARKDGKLTTMTNKQLGKSIKELTDNFIKVHTLFNYLKDTTKSLGGK